MLLAAVVIAALLSANINADEGFGSGEQKWGYADVREGAHLFWWLYYTTANVQSFRERALLIWLQGGPGSSSTGYGNFAEIGPLDVNLNRRDTTWVKDANLLFIDNPVGTGFSYVDNNNLFVTNNTQIALDLVQLMREFYNELPEFEDVPLYVLSESYGGKMAIEFAYYLDQAVKQGTIKSNILGVGLGDSWISPIDSVLTWAPYLLHVGAVDKEGYDKIVVSAEATKAAFDAGQYVQATQLWSRTEGVVSQASNNVDFYNILKPIRNSRTGRTFRPDTRDEDDDKIYAIMNGPVKQTLGLSVTWGAQRNSVFSRLNEDFMKPVTDVVVKVLETTDIKVFVYNGQLDLIVDTPGTLNWVDDLDTWSHISEWHAAARTPLVSNRVNEGYVKSAGNLSFFWVNRAGHMVPADNTAAMDEILRNLTTNYRGV